MLERRFLPTSANKTTAPRGSLLNFFLASPFARPFLNYIIVTLLVSIFRLSNDFRHVRSQRAIKEDWADSGGAMASRHSSTVDDGSAGPQCIGWRVGDPNDGSTGMFAVCQPVMQSSVENILTLDISQKQPSLLTNYPSFPPCSGLHQTLH